MDPLFDSYPIDRCEICGKLVPEADMPKHILGDARMLQLIKNGRPEWSYQECVDHLRTLSETREDPDNGETGLSGRPPEE